MSLRRSSSGRGDDSVGPTGVCGRVHTQSSYYPFFPAWRTGMHHLVRVPGAEAWTARLRDATRSLLPALCVLLLGSAMGCRRGTDPSEPSTSVVCPPTACLLVTGLQFGRTAVVDPDAGLVLGRMGPALDGAPRASLTFDSAKFLYAGYEADSYPIVAVHARSGSERWRFRYPPQTPAQVDYIAPKVIAVSNDEQFVYAFPAIRDGDWVIARVPASGGPLANLSEVSTETRLNVLRGLGFRSAGTVVFVGRQRTGGGSATLFLTSSTLAVQDSVVLPEPPGILAWDVVVSPDETTAYVNLPHRIYAIDLGSGAVRHAAHSQNGMLSMSPTGSHVYVTDPGGYDSFASGIIFEYSADLSARREISLLIPGSVDAPPHARQVAVSVDGRTGYVLTGTPELSAAGLERGSIMVLDLAAGTVTRRIDLGEYVRSPSMFLLEPTPP